MRKELLTLVLLIAAVAAAVSLFHASVSSATGPRATADPPKDGIVLTATAGNVTFNHSKHAAAACDKCHHKPLGDNKTAKCSACHTATSTPTARLAYHGMCVTCHKDAVAKDPALAGKAPVKCAECHKK